MSQNYTHFIVPDCPTYKPSPEILIQFISCIVKHGSLSNPVAISISEVNYRSHQARKMTNAYTGEITELPVPSRRRDTPVAISQASEIRPLVEGFSEFDIVVSSEGEHPSPVHNLGYTNAGTWRKIESAYYAEIRLRVRSRPVYLSRYSDLNEFNAKIDISKMARKRQRFDEDCLESNPIDGIFLHPELGPIVLPMRGSGSFWIEFTYGKSLFPLSISGSVEVTNKSMMDTIHRIFELKFHEACFYG